MKYLNSFAHLSITRFNKHVKKPEISCNLFHLKM